MRARRRCLRTSVDRNRGYLTAAAAVRQPIVAGPTAPIARARLRVFQFVPITRVALLSLLRRVRRSEVIFSPCRFGRRATSGSREIHCCF